MQQAISPFKIVELNASLPLGEEGFIRVSIHGLELSPEEIRLLTIEEVNHGKMRHGPMCGGEIFIRHITPEKSVIVCPWCFFRKEIPIGIKTIGELEDYLKS